ncbi:MAG: flagellar biosynthesis protein FlhB [Gemmataceae bacterium]
MAEDVDEESKTEDPSPRRREEARKQGQVPFSQELVGAVVLLAAVIGLIVFGNSIGGRLLQVIRDDLPVVRHENLTPADAQKLFLSAALRLGAAVAPWFGLMLVAGVAACVVQAGLQLTPEKLELKFDRLNPATGAQRLFSTAALVKGGLAMLKVAAIGGMAYWVFEGRVGVILGLNHDRLSWAAVSAWAVITRLALYLAAATALVAAADYIYQRRRFEVGLRMTKQEVKDELKQEEGDPQLKARMRQLARERMMRKMLTEVPKATVVITNPTHYAVALRYDTPTDDAPVVVARAAGAFALKVIALARDSGVPVVERPTLARAIYAAVKEGRPIPGPLFRAVAEVIAFVYRLRGIGR